MNDPVGTSPPQPRRPDVLFLLAVRSLLVPFSLALLGQLITPAEAAELQEPFMGLYEGSWNVEDSPKAKVHAQVRALGDGRYDGFVSLERSRQTMALIALKSTGTGSADSVRILGEPQSGNAGELLPKVSIEAQIQGGKLVGTLSGELGSGSLTAERIQRKPESLGAKPPAGALVLFDGKDTSHWESFGWKILPGRAMQVTKGDIVVKDRMQSFRLHVEFRTPFMPRASGQARGNSGVYLQRRYEVQVLDSFGLYPLRIDDCGSIYGVKAAAGNACLPPMQWQTYDITYQAANAARQEGPVITVVHNGAKVVDEARVPWDVYVKGTTSSDAQTEGGMLKLQDHGTAVEYRNIWAVPLP